MLVDLELLTEEELKGKVAVLRVTPAGYHDTLNQVNAFLARRPDLQKVCTMMVLVSNSATPLLDAKDVAKAFLEAQQGMVAAQPGALTQPPTPAEVPAGSGGGKKAGKTIPGKFKTADDVKPAKEAEGEVGDAEVPAS